MKIEITKNVTVKETVEIELPYYYEYDVGGDDYSCVIFGKIEENRKTTIAVKSSFGSRAYDLEIEDYSLKSITDQFDERHKSTEGEFLDAKAEMLAAIQKI